MFRSSFLASHKDRDKIQKQHLNDTVEELKRFNARRKLKGAVQAVSGGVASDPLCGADIDSGRHFCIAKIFQSCPILGQHHFFEVIRYGKVFAVAAQIGP